MYFPTTGPHTIQIQQRSDGAIVDQIILSPDAFLSTRPGGTLNDPTIYGSTIDGSAPPPAPPSAPPPAPPIPSPWQQQDIGSVGMSGYASFDNGSSVFTDEAAGADIWGSADSFPFTYAPLNGDGSIVARVATLQNTNVWTKAGVMIRQDLTPGSMNAFTLVSSAEGVYMQNRVTAGSTTMNIAGPVKAAPYWVKLTRAGTTFTAAQSADGVTWTTIGSSTVTVNAAANAAAGCSATITIGGQPFVVTEAPAACGYSIAPTSQAFPNSGGTGSIAVTTGSWCSRNASSDSSWLTITSGASGTGNGTIAFSATANTAGARAGSITAGGRSFTVTEDAAACSYSISPATQSYAAGGGSAAVAVTTGSWCSWTAASTDPTWLTVTSGASGTGNGSVTLTAAGMSVSQRRATRRPRPR